MTYFDLFANNSDSVISEAATLLESITQNFQNKSITEAEYKELCSNVLDFEQISVNITDMIRLQEIANAFKELGTIVGTISTI